MPDKGAKEPITAVTAPVSTYSNNALVLEKELSNTSSHTRSSPALRAGVTTSALCRDIHRVATDPMVPNRAVSTSPSGSHSLEIVIIVPPPVSPLGSLSSLSTTSGMYRAVAVRFAGYSSVATTTAPGPRAGISHSIIAEDTNSAGQLDSPTWHREISGTKSVPTIATVRGDPKVDTRRGTTLRTSPVNTDSASPSTAKASSTVML